MVAFVPHHPERGRVVYALSAELGISPVLHPRAARKPDPLPGGILEDRQAAAVAPTSLLGRFATGAAGWYLGTLAPGKPTPRGPYRGPRCPGSTTTTC